MRVEEHGLGEFAEDLRRAGRDITGEVEKVTGMACNNMKKTAQRIVRGYPHLPHLPRSFNYDVNSVGTTVTGEVGADRDKLQGGLDAYIEDGTPTSAPIPHWRPAFEKEEPAWRRYLDQVAAEAIEGRR